jgi:hypothetical protein
MEDNFKYFSIDECQHDQDLNSYMEGSIDQVDGDKITPVNNIPKPMVRLEKLYDLQDKFKRVTNYKTNSSSMHFEVINLGTDSTP